MKKNQIRLIMSWIISISLVVYLVSKSDKQVMLDGFIYHYFCTLALSVFGVPIGKAMAYGVVLQACQVLPTTITGLLFLPYFGLNSTKEMIQ